MDEGPEDDHEWENNDLLYELKGCRKKRLDYRPANLESRNQLAYIQSEALESLLHIPDDLPMPAGLEQSVAVAKNRPQQSAPSRK